MRAALSKWKHFTFWPRLLVDTEFQFQCHKIAKGSATLAVENADAYKFLGNGHRHDFMQQNSDFIEVPNTLSPRRVLRFESGMQEEAQKPCQQARNIYLSSYQIFISNNTKTQ